MQVAVDQHEAVRLVPTLDVRVVARPGLEPRQARCTARAARPRREAHAAIPRRWWSGWTARCQIIPPAPGRSASTPGGRSYSRSSSPTICTVRVRDELDRRVLVPLLLPQDVVEERGAEERERTTAHPADLVRRLVGPDRDQAATLLRLPATLSVALGGVVQLVRTPACHAGGRGFESLFAPAPKPPLRRLFRCGTRSARVPERGFVERVLKHAGRRDRRSRPS